MKKGLMQDLLMGKVRMKADDPEGGYNAQAFCHFDDSQDSPQIVRLNFT